MRIVFWADILYYRIAGGTTRYAARLSTELLSLSDINLHLLSLYSPEVIARLSQDRGCLEASSVSSRLPRQLHYMLWLIGWAGPSADMVRDVDVVHVPWMTVPPHGQAPLVVTVHDLVPLLFPEYLNFRTRWMAQMGLDQAKRKAAAFIANSNNTASDLMRLAGVPKQKIYVTPLAADERFYPVVDTTTIRERYKLDMPFVLYVGTLEPRKNLETLVRAFVSLGKLDAKLVIAGKKGWMYKELLELLEKEQYASRVIFIDFVPDEDLPALMSAAEVFVYPSIYEGFGLPVLEAMQCGTPVITTNVSSLPEVAGEAAILVAPNDVDGLKEAIKRVLSESELREELRGRGLERARCFSWRKTAELTAEVYRQVCRKK